MLANSNLHTAPGSRSRMPGPAQGRPRSWGEDRATAATSLLVVLLCGIAAGCGSGDLPSDPDPPVAHVGEVPITLSEVELYLAVNLFVEEGVDETDPATLDRVKSRVFDNLADQKRLLAEAERRQLQVSDAEIDARLESGAEFEAAAPGLSHERRRKLVRHRLTIRKLQERLAERWPPLTDEAIRTHAERSRDRFASGERVRLRALRFASAEDAALAAARIEQGQMTFVEAVLTYETDPGQGVPLELPWATLPDDMRDALGSLQPGEVSRPVDFHGDTYLFQLESRLNDPAARDADLIDRARDELERQRRRAGIEGLLRRLRRAMPLRVDEKRLPFSYVAETGSRDTP